MERAHWVGIGIMAAAVALFGARFALDHDEGLVAVNSGVVRVDPAAGAVASAQGGVRSAARRGRGGAGVASADPRAPRIRRGPAGPAGARMPARGGAAVVSGGDRRGGARAGRAVGERRGGGGTSVRVAGSLPPRRRGGAAETMARAPGRSDLVELLAAQPLPQPSAAGAGTEEGEDVVLAVEKPEDIEQAQRVEDVEHDGVALDLEEDSVFAFPNAGNARGDAGAITFEVEPRWAGADETNNAFVRIQDGAHFENRLELVKNGRYLRFIFTPANGREADISVPIDSWDPGEPHSITATWGPIDPDNPERGGQTTLYIDGRPVGSNRYEGEMLIPPNTPMYVGSATGNYKGANARLGNFRVYGRTLAPEEVR